MLKRLNTYRHLLLSLLLVSYVLSAFPRPFFEGLHLVAHTAEFIQATYQQHTLHDHQGDHHHHHLEVAQTTKKQSDEKQQTAPNDLKKKVEISDQGNEIPLLFSKEIDNNFGVLLTLKTTYPDLISPPPQDLA